jgi:hypothetical protein
LIRHTDVADFASLRQTRALLGATFHSLWIHHENSNRQNIAEAIQTGQQLHAGRTVGIYKVQLRRKFLGLFQ